MRRAVASLAVMVLGLAVGPIGCGPDAFAPPPELVVSANTTATTPADVVFLVLPAAPDTDAVYATWMEAGLKEANDLKFIFRVSGPEPGKPPSGQIEAIREAIAGGATGLIVVPYDDGAIAPILAEAEGKGIAVVTLGATSGAGSQLPGTAVVPEPFAKSAAELVRAVVEDARSRQIAADPPAVLLFDKVGDRYAAGRVEALRDAAKAAGLTHLEMLGYKLEGQGEGRTVALDLLAGWIKNHPDTAIVLAEGDEAMAAANRYRTETKDDTPILVAGYIGFRGESNPFTLKGNSAFVEGRLNGLAKLAIRTVLDKAHGKASGPTVVMPTPLNRSLGQAMRDDGTVTPPPLISPRPINDPEP